MGFIFTFPFVLFLSSLPLFASSSLSAPAPCFRCVLVLVLCVCVCGVRREQGSSLTVESGAPHQRLGCLTNVQVLRLFRTL
jgi:hypothetical protein